MKLTQEQKSQEAQGRQCLIEAAMTVTRKLHIMGNKDLWPVFVWFFLNPGCFLVVQRYQAPPEELQL